MKIATVVLIFAISFAASSFKKNNITTNICLSGSQDSLPALHTISDKDIASVTSSFEDRTITVTLKNNTVYTYNHSQWDYEDYYSSISPRIKDATRHNAMTFTKCQIPPSFPGGEDAWNKYMSSFADKHHSEISDAGGGEIKMQFIVHLHGQITDIAKVSGDATFEALTKQALKESPAWICGKQNGHDVVAYATQVIKF